MHIYNSIYIPNFEPVTDHLKSIGSVKITYIDSGRTTIIFPAMIMFEF